LKEPVTDTSLFCLPVQTSGADVFKLVLYLIYGGLEGVNARIVDTLHAEAIIKVRDGIEDQVRGILRESMEEAFKKIIPAQ
jgi:DNA polymerase I-like protein with 3'-5' exonuclease and polymerase domains